MKIPDPISRLGIPTLLIISARLIPRLRKPKSDRVNSLWGTPWPQQRQIGRKILAKISTKTIFQAFIGSLVIISKVNYRWILPLGAVSLIQIHTSWDTKEAPKLTVIQSPLCIIPVGSSRISNYTTGGIPIGYDEVSRLPRPETPSILTKPVVIGFITTPFVGINYQSCFIPASVARLIRCARCQTISNSRFPNIFNRYSPIAVFQRPGPFIPRMPTELAWLRLRAYPKTPAARQVIQAHGFSTFFSQRISSRRKRWSQECVHSTTQRLAR